jgi:hypothetical protein
MANVDEYVANSSAWNLLILMLIARLNGKASELHNGLAASYLIAMLH